MGRLLWKAPDINTTRVSLNADIMGYDPLSAVRWGRIVVLYGKLNVIQFALERLHAQNVKSCALKTAFLGFPLKWLRSLGESTQLGQTTQFKD